MLSASQLGSAQLRRTGNYEIGENCHASCQSAGSELTCVNAELATHDCSCVVSSHSPRLLRSRPPGPAARWAWGAGARRVDARLAVLQSF